MPMPAADTEEAYHALRPEDLLAGADALRAHLGLSDVDMSRFEDGSLPVYALGNRVLKLYPPVYLDEVAVESGVLAAVHDKLPIPTPALERAGEFEGWGYVLMSRLAGRSLVSVWPELSTADRSRLAAQLGEALAALHSVPEPELGPRDWDGFLDGQRANCVQRQRAKGLDEEWLALLPEFLSGVELDPPRRDALLHTEVMREHLLVTRTGEGWSLSGLFDFEPAMRGAPEYEFAAVGVFFSGGDGAVLRQLLSAYGYRANELDLALQRRLLAYEVLHVQSNLRWFLERVPTTAKTMDDLARHWFALHP